MLTTQETQSTSFQQNNIQTSAIQFRGDSGILNIIVNPEASLFFILEELEEQLQNNQRFLESSKVGLSFGARSLDPIITNEIQRVLRKYSIKLEQITIQLEGIMEFLSDAFGAPVHLDSPPPLASPQIIQNTEMAVPPRPTKTDHNILTKQHSESPEYSESPENSAYSESPENSVYSEEFFNNSTAEYDILKEAPSYIAPISDTTEEISEELQPVIEVLSQLEENSQLHKVMKTCRGGTFLEFDGDVVIFGDVNAGAEIRATGDIIIFGTLRGIAHAGYNGNKNAIITAFSLNPTQLRLNTQIEVPPENEEHIRPQIYTEIAYLTENNRIVVEKYTGKASELLQERFSSY